jgi:hypothetical protein
VNERVPALSGHGKKIGSGATAASTPASQARRTFCIQDCDDAKIRHYPD